MRGAVLAGVFLAAAACQCGFDPAKDCGFRPCSEAGADGGDGGAPTPGCAAASGAIAWWDGDAVEGTRALERLAGHDAFAPSPVVQVPAVVGRGFLITDPAAVLEVRPDAPELGPTLGLTVEAWVRPNPSGRAFRRLLSKQVDDTEADSSWIFGLGAGGGVYFGLFKGGRQTYVDGAVPVSTARWSHIAGTWDGLQMRIYLDGVAQAEGATFGAPAGKSSQPVRLGGGNTTTYVFDGAADEVTLYGRALGAAEVTAIFAAGPAGKCRAP